MKKLTFLLVVLFMAGAVFSQSDAMVSNKLSKEDVSKFINETNVIITKTSEIVKTNDVYTGGVVKSIEVQKRAIALFKNGHLQKAINKSFKARRCAIYAYKSNSESSVPKSWPLTEAEKSMVTVTLTKAQIENIIKPSLEQEKNESNLNTTTLNDVE